MNGYTQKDLDMVTEQERRATFGEYGERVIKDRASIDKELAKYRMTGIDIDVDEKCALKHLYTHSNIIYIPDFIVSIEAGAFEQMWSEHRSGLTLKCGTEVTKVNDGYLLYMYEECCFDCIDIKSQALFTDIVITCEKNKTTKIKMCIENIDEYTASVCIDEMLTGGEYRKNIAHYLKNMAEKAVRLAEIKMYAPDAGLLDMNKRIDAVPAYKDELLDIRKDTKEDIRSIKEAIKKGLVQHGIKGERADKQLLLEEGEAGENKYIIVSDGHEAAISYGFDRILRGQADRHWFTKALGTEAGGIIYSSYHKMALDFIEHNRCAMVCRVAFNSRYDADELYWYGIYRIKGNSQLIVKGLNGEECIKLDDFIEKVSSLEVWT